jgi:hypothetical protein
MVLEALVPPQQEACKAAPGTDEQEADQPTECRLTSWLRPPTNATVAHVQGVLCADEYTACSGAGGCSDTVKKLLARTGLGEVEEGTPASDLAGCVALKLGGSCARTAGVGSCQYVGDAMVESERTTLVGDATRYDFRHILLHLDNMDDMAHYHGGADPEYNREDALEKGVNMNAGWLYPKGYTKPADSYNLAINNVTRHISRLVAALRRRGRAEANTGPGSAAASAPWVMVINSDHGHRDPGGHGGSSVDIMEIPIVLWKDGAKLRDKAEQKDTVWAPPGGEVPLVFPTVDRFYTALLYGCAGCLTALFGVFRPGHFKGVHEGTKLPVPTPDSLDVFGKSYSSQYGRTPVTDVAATMTLLHGLPVRGPLCHLALSVPHRDAPN